MIVSTHKTTQTSVYLNVNENEMRTFVTVLESYRSHAMEGSPGDVLAGRILDAISPLSSGRKRVTT